MTDVSRLDVDFIRHVVPVGNEVINVLYLSDGRIVRLNVVTGDVLSVSRLPKNDALVEGEKKKRVRVSIPPSSSEYNV